MPHQAAHEEQQEGSGRGTRVGLAPRGRMPLQASGGAKVLGPAVGWAWPLLWATVCSLVREGASHLLPSLHKMERRPSSKHGNSPQQGCPGYPGLPHSLISVTSFHEVTT